MTAVLDCAGQYVYLTAGLVTLLLLSGVLRAIRPTWRRATVTCGVLSMPLSLMALLLAPEYWKPKGVLELPVLLEDFLFMFNVGATSWLSGSWAYGDRLMLGRVRNWAFVRRSLVTAAASLAAGAVLHCFGVKIGHSILVFWTLSAIALLLLRPDLRGVMTAAATFGALYFTLAACVFAAAPDFASAWNHANLLGWKLLGVPVDEIVWATGFGAVWPAFLMYATQGRILPCTIARAG